MVTSYAILMIILITFIFFAVPFYLTNGFRKSKISKYIPSILCLISILALYIKLTFFCEGYSGLIYIAFMFLLAISFVILFLVALIFEFKSKRKL